MAELRAHLERNLVQAEALGQTDRAKALKARIAEVEKTEAKVEGLADQSVADVLADVGDDPELAAAALEAENAREKPRKTLVTKLQAVVDGTG